MKLDNNFLNNSYINTHKNFDNHNFVFQDSKLKVKTTSVITKSIFSCICLSFSMTFMWICHYKIHFNKKKLVQGIL